MAEIHITTAGVVAHNPGVAPTVKGAGQPIAQTKDASGKVTSTSGQVPGGSVVHNNPA
jgi:hypothetical protein